MSSHVGLGGCGLPLWLVVGGPVGTAVASGEAVDADQRL